MLLQSPSGTPPFLPFLGYPAFAFELIFSLLLLPFPFLPFLSLLFFLSFPFLSSPIWFFKQNAVVISVSDLWQTVIFCKVAWVLSFQWARLRQGHLVAATCVLVTGRCDVPRAKLGKHDRLTPKTLEVSKLFCFIHETARKINEGN